MHTEDGTNAATDAEDLELMRQARAESAGQPPIPWEQAKAELDALDAEGQ